MSATVERSETQVTVTCALEPVSSSREIDISLDELTLLVETPFHQLQLRLCAPVHPEPISCQFQPSTHRLVVTFAVPQQCVANGVPAHGLDPWSKVLAQMDDFDRRVAALSGAPEDHEDLSALGQRLTVYDNKIEFVGADRLAGCLLQMDMVDRRAYKQQEEHGVGLGGTQWEAGAVLAAWLCRWEGLRDGTTVLELGSGLGLCATVAGLLGACVTATDYVPRVLHTCAKNAEAHRALGKCDVQVVPLLWGLEGVAEFLQRQQQGGSNVAYDVVMASDVIYDQEVHEILLETVIKLFGPKTVGVFVNQQRNSSDLGFFELLQLRGLVVKPIEDIDTLGVPGIVAHFVRLST